MGITALDFYGGGAGLIIILNRVNDGCVQLMAKTAQLQAQLQAQLRTTRSLRLKTYT
ncbi:hypothetical protein [Coleofasciculus sp. F4-SAH-05]|uniref:hypothetical protein n=1 Tax=Coleofasciculus sp. F4-SAH-05 TaxID=3069525 RepID=UPI0032F4495B